MEYNGPAQNTGLEFDPGQAGLHLSHKGDALPESLHTQVTPHKQLEKATASEQAEIHFKLPRSTFWLSIALAIALASAIVAAALGGSLAGQRQHRMNKMRVPHGLDNGREILRLTWFPPDSLPVILAMLPLKSRMLSRQVLHQSPVNRPALQRRVHLKRPLALRAHLRATAAPS
jgi:hypothetical protein